MKFLCFILICLTSPTFGYINLTADKDSAMIGEPIQLTISSNQLFEKWPVLQDSLAGGFEILDQTKDSNLTNSGKEFIKQLTITNWETGYKVITPLTINNKKSNPILIKITTGLIDQSNPIQPISEPLQTPFIVAEIYWLFPWILGALISFGIFYYLYKKKLFRKSKIKHSEIPVPITPLYQIIEQELSNLRKQDLLAKGYAKSYYVQATILLKKALGFRYDLPIKEATTDQALKMISNHPQRIKLEQTLKSADNIKYAKGQNLDILAKAFEELIVVEIEHLKEKSTVE